MSSITETTSLGGTIISMASSVRGAAGIVSKSSNLNIEKAGQIFSTISHSSKTMNGFVSQSPTSSISQLHTMNILGPVGAITALAADGIALGMRSKKAMQLKNELEKLPLESQLLWKRQVLEAMSEYANGMVKSSTVGVAADSLAVTGSFIPVVGGIPASIIGVSVAVLRVLAENQLDDKLREKLEKITEDYRNSHPTIIQHSAAFRELHQTLKDHYDQAVAKNDEAEKAYLNATKTYERTFGTVEEAESHLKLSEAATALNSTEHALQDMRATLQDYETEKANFDAYEQALLLIRDLEPKETPQDERELGVVTATRLSTYTETESLAFSPGSEFSSDEETSNYVTKSSIGITKTERALQDIGIITPKDSEKSKASKKDSFQLNQDLEKETEPQDERELDSIKIARLFACGSVEALPFA